MSDDKVAAVTGYSADAIGVARDRITEVRRFEAGNRHDVYKVSLLDAEGATTALVVRVSLSADVAEREAAEREASVLEVVGGVAAPLLHDFRSTSPWFDRPTMCLQFVDGQPTAPSSVTLPQIERLGSVTAWVHGRPTDESAASGSISSYAEVRLHSILSTLRWAGDPLSVTVRDPLQRAADAIRDDFERWQRSECFRTDEPLVLLHGDIAEGNVLWQPDPVLIDWEYARLGDPSDEIAYTFDQNGLSGAQREAFWHGYRNEIGDPSRLDHIAERVVWWEPVTVLGSTLWWVERWVRRTEADITGEPDPATPKEPDYYFDEVVERLDRLGPLVARMLRS